MPRFETFFCKHPKPVKYSLFSSEIGKTDTIISFNTVEPELVIPIMGPSGLYGMILVGRNILGADYNERELSFIQDLMSFVSKAIPRRRPLSLLMWITSRILMIHSDT
jgi:hypothetical protein